MSTFTIKKNDTLPTLTVVLLQAAGTRNEAAVDLTDASSVKFKMRPWPGGDVVVDAAASIIDAAAGRVSYVWTAGDTAASGTYAAEWEVTFPTGTMTFPSGGYDTVVVVDDVS